MGLITAYCKECGSDINFFPSPPELHKCNHCGTENTKGEIKASLQGFTKGRENSDQWFKQWFEKPEQYDSLEDWYADFHSCVFNIKNDKEYRYKFSRDLSEHLRNLTYILHHRTINREGKYTKAQIKRYGELQDILYNMSMSVDAIEKDEKEK